MHLIDILKRNKLIFLFSFFFFSIASFFCILLLTIKNTKKKHTEKKRANKNNKKELLVKHYSEYNYTKRYKHPLSYHRLTHSPTKTFIEKLLLVWCWVKGGDIWVSI